jgi:hypothetical protein
LAKQIPDDALAAIDDAVRRHPGGVSAQEVMRALAAPIPLRTLQYRLKSLVTRNLAAAAFADRDLAQAVARHKGMFFAEKAADRSPIDYVAAVGGGLRLVPTGDPLTALEEDYARMVEDGLLLEDAEPFEALMARCADIAARANRAGA